MTDQTLDPTDVLWSEEETRSEFARWQYDLRERFMLALERAQDAFDRGDIEAARLYVERGLDVDNYETGAIIRLFTVDDDAEPTFGVVAE